MEIENIFERAGRNKTRFAYKGSLSVEDLWDLSVQELDRIFKGLNAKLKVCKEESLLGSKSSENAEMDLQVAIVRRIVEVKLAEAAAKEQEAAKKAEIQRLLGALTAKEDEILQKMSKEEIEKRLAEL